MTWKQKRVVLAAFAVLAALVIAFLLRDVVEQVIIRPSAYLFWMLGLFYRMIPQPVLWMLLVLVMIYLVLGGLVGKLAIPGTRPQKLKPVQGPVAELAGQIESKEGGIYLKWKIARTLGQIALDLQESRLPDRSRVVYQETVPPQVRRYIDAGLNTSFSDYPLPSFSIFGVSSLRLPGREKSTSPTPFECDLDAVIGYLESEMENDDDLRRP